MFDVATAGLNRRDFLRALAALGVAPGVIGLAGCGGSTPSSTSARRYTIAFSNSYIGNSFRLEMQNLWQTAMQLEPYKTQVNGPILNSNNDINQERLQLDGLISQKVDAICIDAGSSTALNGVIAQATSRGIVVVSFDNVVTAPSALKIEADNIKWGGLYADFIVKKIGGRGNVLMVTGVPGAPEDALRNQGGEQVFNQHPDIKVLKVVGMWDSSIAQKNVAAALPSLPKIDGVWVSAGTDGVLRAFLQQGGPLPVFAGEAENGYRKALAGILPGAPKVEGISVTEPTYMPVVALELARQVLLKQTQPHNIELPLQTITSEDIKPGESVFPDVPDSFADGITDTGAHPVVHFCVQSALNALPCPEHHGRLVVNLP